MASYNPTSLTLSLFTEVPVLSQESDSTQIHSLERSCSVFSDPKAVLFHLAKFLVEAMLQIHHHNSFLTTYNKMKKVSHRRKSSKNSIEK
jgi:methylglyoxal synthase